MQERLAALGLVNESDVAEHAPGFLDEHGAWFRRLTAAWEPVLTPAVAVEAVRVFGRAQRRGGGPYLARTGGGSSSTNGILTLYCW